MGGYCNLVSSPPVASGGGGAEESKWEGVAVGAATLARSFSSISQRFRAVERSRSTSSGGGGGGLQAVVRRACSMGRQPSGLVDGYWRIHDDMDGDDTADEHLEQVFEEVEQQEQNHASRKKEKMKKKGRIFKAFKKILRL
ncbi:hypothetical protein GUJ93_ZPchr0001g29979 [Zizania palustris]|uniref:Uncharacterized protein n=1 Tax=Zizania palustris TaxID=103762 RepID=A0A8J5SC17_ZIZPA|nr:hypothetical protein GUJ93_ZPchr0001g29979 [Zizania palustris]